MVLISLEVDCKDVIGMASTSLRSDDDDDEDVFVDVFLEEVEDDERRRRTTTIAMIAITATPATAIAATPKLELEKSPLLDDELELVGPAGLPDPVPGITIPT